MIFRMQKTTKCKTNAFLMLLLLINIPLFSFTACSNVETKDNSISLQLNSSTDESSDTLTENDIENATTEPIEWKGSYLLSDIQQNDGFYIKYDDSSFDRYAAGGYWAKDPGGVFLKNKIANQLPVVDNQTNLVGTWNGDFTLYVLPVSSEARVISMKSGDMDAFGMLDVDKTIVTAFRRNGTFERYYLATINGKPAEDYPAKIEERTVNPYAGAPSRSFIVKTTSFEKDSLVTLGIKEGSSLIEEQYYADATFYDFDSQHKSWDTPESYMVKCNPTIDGYADLDFSGIPNGKYAMILYGVKDNRVTYIATVITLDK